MSIPASRIVTINPSAVSTGGNPLAMNTLLLVDGPTITTGVQQFGSALEVGNYYGLSSAEYAFAERYFLGYDGATRAPSALFTVQKPGAALPAILRGASVRTMTLAQLKTVSGEFTVNAGGAPVTITLDFSGVDSFSDAAALLTDTNSFVGDFNETQQAFEITSITSGATVELSFATGAAAELLKMTQATGAQYSAGRNVQTAAELMKYVMGKTQNFGVITHVAEPARAVKEEYSAWVTTQNSRFAYVAQDTDGSALVANNNSSFGQWLAETNQNGTTAYFGTIAQVAALCGGIAAINFARTNGRRNIMFMRQSGLSASVTDEAEYTALLSNGYTFYGSFATANDEFTFNVNGAVAGQFKWLDNYINQIYLNAQFQLAMVNMLIAYGSIPYNETGKAYHRAAAMAPINEMLNFGAIVPLVDPNALSEQQKSIINSQAGFDIVPQLLAKGWAMVIQTASAQVRGNRGAMPFTVWYSDGGSIQAVNMASINVQ